MHPTEPPQSPRLPIAPHRQYRDFVAADECAALLDWALANKARFMPGVLRKGVVQPEVRRSRVLRDLGELRPLLKQRLLDQCARLVDDLSMAPFVAGHVELELAAHNDGDSFVLHTDTYTGDDRPERGDRMVSGVYYFHREPKAFSGGSLRLHRFGATLEAPRDFLDVEPEQNSLVVFPSWAPHEVRPVACPSKSFADSRFSVNCWIYRPRGQP